MTRPGVEILSSDLGPPRSSPTDVGAWFVVGAAERGPLTPVEITSMSQYSKQFGIRTGFTTLYDSAETYFREGGSRLVISRAAGVGNATAGVSLNDAVPAATLRVDAKNPGVWGNSLTVQVIAGTNAGEFILIIFRSGVEVERSPSLVDKAAALAWDDNSNYVNLTDLAGTGDPAVVAATALTGGSDGAALVESDWTAALGRIPKDLGPGQVSMPGRTTTTAHGNLLQHAKDNNRVALLDTADTATIATLTTNATAYRTNLNARYGAMFGPWVVVPGVVLGTFRTVPPSALVAGIISRNDGEDQSANVAAAGQNGISRWATSLSQANFTDIDRATLNLSGFNVIRNIYDTIRIYGYRSLVDPTTTPLWVAFGNARLYMQIASEADAAGEMFLFDQLDGQGTTIAQFGAELTAICTRHFDEGSLYGLTPEEAFFVDVGSQVNTPDTIAANELHAVISLRMSPFGELVVIEIVKVPITQEVV